MGRRQRGGTPGDPVSADSPRDAASSPGAPPLVWYRTNVASPSADNIGFLLAKATQRWNELLTMALSEAGYPQVRASYGSVLLPLWGEDGLRMGALAQRARLSKQTMTTLVRLVERAGLVERSVDPSDRRATRVWLTAVGRELGPVAGAVVDDLAERVISALGPQATQSLRRSLTSIMDLPKEHHMNVAAHSPAELITLFAGAMRDGRLDDAVALYEDDAVFIAQPDTNPVSGRDAIRSALAEFAALRPELTADIRKVVEAGDIATVLNSWQLTGAAPDGSPVRLNGLSADVMRRRADGSWGILIDDPWGAPATP